MFSSFFPSPRLFFSSVVVWTFVCIGCWYAFAADLGALLGFASEKPTGELVIGVGHFFTPEYIWFDIYYAAATGLYATVWHRLQPHARHEDQPNRRRPPDAVDQGRSLPHAARERPAHGEPVGL